ncbi:MAG: Cof-type HAD-IIB family hydrolase [bacterium]
MKKHDIKMIVLDIDGTIMDSNFQISERVKNTINLCQSKGIKVVLATGRMHAAAVPIAQKIGLTGPIISYQGSVIREYTPKDKTLREQKIDFPTALEVIKELRKFDGQINFFTENQLYVENVTDLLIEYTEKRNINFETVSNFEELSELSPIKLLCIHKNSEKLTMIKEQLRAKFSQDLNIFKSTEYFCEIVDKYASKGNAINYLAELWNIKNSQILSIGDHENDIEMLKTSGVSVAMGNAIEAVKAVTTYITETVNNDGAAIAMEKIVIGL